MNPPAATPAAQYRQPPTERPSAHGLLALLLQYPDSDILDARGDIAEAVRSLGKPWVREAAFEAFLSWWVATPGWELQSAFVTTFDLGRRCSLHLTYPLFGDRRERGMALLRLKRRYAAHGFELSEAELPDFLAVVLEYAASDPDGEALLVEYRVSIDLLRAALHDAGDPYAAPVAALGTLLGPLSAAESARVLEIGQHGPPMEEVGLEPFAPPEIMPVETGGLRR